MKIVIDIPDYVYEHAKNMSEDSNDEYEAMRAIAKGFPYEERPHGEWEKVGEMTYKCTKCGWLKKTGLMPFCENCGADMRKEGESE